MKPYSEYTDEELDELYANLSEVAEAFVYSDQIKEEVATVGKLTKLHIDKWEALDTLILETILGIVPSIKFMPELMRRLGVDADQAEGIASYLDETIFSVIREESIASYNETTAKNSHAVKAIYDETSILKPSDPYRESLPPYSGAGPVITEEKLHIVDQLFAQSTPKVKELTPSDGSVRVPTEETKHVPDLFVAPKKLSTAKEEPVSPFVVTKQSLEREDSGVKAKPRTEAFAGASSFDDIIKKLPPLTGAAPAKQVLSTTPSTSTNKDESASELTLGVRITVERSPTDPTKVLLRIEKDEASAAVPVTKNSSGDLGEKSIPATTPKDLSSAKPAAYTVDPYKEII